ncbi:hypothetical protein ACWDCC_33205 [Streptomyces sp. NPDC001102]
MAVRDQADGESEEALVDVVASFPADAQAAEAVQGAIATLGGCAFPTEWHSPV